MPQLRARSAAIDDLSARVAELGAGGVLAGEVRAVGERVDAAVQGLAGQVQGLHERLAAMETRLAAGEARLDGLRAVGGALLDDVPTLRRRLEDVRADPSYEAVWDDPEPLITVRIATFNLADVLVERALASVLRQTYQRFEVVVVGDGCTDDTEARIHALGDPRIRFVDLPMRGEYPGPGRRHLVAGAPAMNHAAAQARGTWLAPLDDDDEFEPDHLEVLLAKALEGRYELAYGNFRMVTPDQEPVVLGRWPPTYGEFGYQTSIYLTALRFFESDHRSWILDEPADMVMRRRMMEAGVRMGWVDKVVCTYYPGQLHRPSRS